MVVSKADGNTDSIVLNKRMSDGSIENTLEGGDFDVEIDAGPSFAVQKSEALEFFQQTLQASPQVFPLIADLWAENLDIEKRQQVIERFKTMVPPEILAKEEGKPPPPKQPNPQEQAMQMEMAQKQQQLQLNMQKMRLEEEALLERAEELKIRKEKHLLDQADMMLKAQEMQSKMGLEQQKIKIEHGKLLLDADRTEKDFSSTIAKVLSDLHKHANPHEKKGRE